MTTRRKWGFPSLFATGLATQFPDHTPIPAADWHDPAPVDDPTPDPDQHPRPLSWDAEDAAIAAGECPWCPTMLHPKQGAKPKPVF